MCSVNEFQCLIDQILNWFFLLWIMTPKNLFYFLNFTKPWQNYYKKRWGCMLQINYIHSDVNWFEGIMIILFSSPFYLNKVDNNFVRNTCTWMWNKRTNLCPKKIKKNVSIFLFNFSFKLNRTFNDDEYPKNNNYVIRMRAFEEKFIAFIIIHCSPQLCKTLMTKPKFDRIF